VILDRIFKKNNQSSPNSRRFCVIYSTAMIMLSTINIACNAVWGEEMWIVHRDDVGGVPHFIATQESVWYQTLASTSVISCIFLGDALLIYRLFSVYGRSYAVIFLPTLAYIAGFGLAMTQVIMSGLPRGNFFGGEAAKVATAYYVITVSLNIVLTILICSRLMRVSKRVASALGRGCAEVYISTAAVLVESSALYSAFGIMYLIPFALEAPIADLFGQLWTKLSVICPLLIIVRVVTGRAWMPDATVTSRTPVAFATHSVGVLVTSHQIGLEEFEPTKSSITA